MVKQRETNAKRWGTLEELLLASAVNRHGTASWESVAMEIHNRCSHQSSSSLTPQDCRNKFYDLKRRFLSQNVLDSDSDPTTLMPMLDELRKIRVQELRRDVERRDVLIVSLEMKVKRLEEERDRSSNQSPEGSDLDTDKAKTNLHLQNPAASGDDSDDRENRSLNESNSTSKKDDVRQNGVVEDNPIIESVNMSKMEETGPPKTGDEPGREWSFESAGQEPEPEPDPEAKPEREKKSSGGYKRREKERNWGNLKAAVVDSNEAWESVSESKQDGKEGAVSKQQSSDVQSSGSLSQRKRCRNSSGEEPEVSPAKPKPKALAVKTEPLLKLLDIIRSHQLGSTFERRLRSQESDRYKNLIRQHIDLRTIRCRVVKGAYADSIHRFFRDLLLLFNNAIIFFHRSSPENGAALKLRALVLKDMKDHIDKPQPIVLKSKPKQETDLSLPSSKPTTKPSTTTIVGCRKRDSVATDCKKVDKNSRDIEVKPKVSDSSEIKIYEKGTWKKGLNSKERLRPTSTPTPANSGQRSSRTSSTSKNNGEVKHEYGGNELSSHDGMEVRMEKKERVTKKKQGAVSFLKRMKQNSPNEAAEEDGDASENECIKEEEEEEEEEEGKRKVKRQKEGKRERVRRSGGGGGGGGRGKKAVGRPPKKTETVTVKRQQREEVSNSKPQKRSRR